MTYGAALDALVEGPKAKVVKTFKLTIPEGLSRREMAPQGQGRRQGRLPEGDREGRRAAPRAPAGRCRKGTKTVEGFLFPATYDLVDGATADDLVDEQLQGVRRQHRPGAD